MRLVSARSRVRSSLEALWGRWSRGMILPSGGRGRGFDSRRHLWHVLIYKKSRFFYVLLRRGRASGAAEVPDSSFWSLRRDKKSGENFLKTYLLLLIWYRILYQNIVKKFKKFRNFQKFQNNSKISKILKNLKKSTFVKTPWWNCHFWSVFGLKLVFVVLAWLFCSKNQFRVCSYFL